MNFSVMLIEFQNSELPEQITPMLNNKEVQNLISIWSKVKIGTLKDLPKIEVDLSTESGKWEWLWNHIEVDFGDLTNKLGIERKDTKSTFNIAKGAQLIYPDGSVHKFARQMLRVQIMKLLPKEIRKKKQEKKPEGLDGFFD